MSAKRTNRYNSGQSQQKAAGALIDELDEFERYKTEMLPKLRRAIESGKSASDIAKIGAAAAMARAVTTAITEKDPARALGYINAVLDRAEGKAAQKTEITTKFQKMSDEELDALLNAELTSTHTEADDSH